MLHHPSENFIKYLLTLTDPEAQQDTWIQMGVQAFGFPAPSADYVASMREFLYKDLPVNYDPKDRYNRPSVKFLRATGVWSMHNPDDSVRSAITILPNVRVRKLVEQLLLGRIEPKEVAKKVNSRMGTFFKAADIQTYSHYYWNCALLKTQDWIDFYEAYESTEKSKSIAILHNGPAMALHATGFHQHLESKEMLREMQEALYFDFRDWKAQPRSMNKTRAMTALAKASTQVDVRLSEADSALRDSLKAFEQFRMEHASKSVKSIDDIAPHGNFTESGADIKELPPAPSESERKVG